MKKTIMLLLLSCGLLLSACGQKSAAPPDAKTDAPQEQTLSSSTAPTTNDNQTNNDKTIATDDSKQIPTDADEVIPKAYHMNKVYNIVPNEEGTEKNIVLLTFDDGPKEKQMIDSLIDTLDKHHAKAIFFVNGYRVKAHPELLKLIHDRGQIIGNHSWDHINLKKESNDKIKKQIEDVQQIVQETIGETPKFFRPPFGAGNDEVRKVVKDNGMLFMTWSNGSLDWDSKNKNKPEAVIKNVLEQLHPGSNILMHELPWTVEALDDLLTKLEEKGYVFVDPRAIDFEKSLK